MIEKRNKMASVMKEAANHMLIVAANRRCTFIYHQPKQPEELKKFRKF